MKLWFRSSDDKLIKAFWSALLRKLVMLANISDGSEIPRKRFLVDRLEQKTDERKSKLAIKFTGNIILSRQAKKLYDDK
jgi:hypothetical protein